MSQNVIGIILLGTPKSRGFTIMVSLALVKLIFYQLFRFVVKVSFDMRLFHFHNHGIQNNITISARQSSLCAHRFNPSYWIFLKIFNRNPEKRKNKKKKEKKAGESNFKEYFFRSKLKQKKKRMKRQLQSVLFFTQTK